MKTIHSDFLYLQKLVFEPLGLEITNFQLSIESKEYDAYSFHLNDNIIEFRTAKITPTKIGQFVTFWKRSKDGSIMPFDVIDAIDFFIVNVVFHDRRGLFIFPQSILIEKDIVSVQGIGGKRAIRVYPAWDRPDSKQAIKTQAWQLAYFFEVGSDEICNVVSITQLLKIKD